MNNTDAFVSSVKIPVVGAMHDGQDLIHPIGTKRFRYHERLNFLMIFGYSYIPISFKPVVYHLMTTDYLVF